MHLTLTLIFLLQVVGFDISSATEVLPRVTPAEAGLDAVSLEETSAMLRRYVATRRISGAVAMVARDGKLGYVESVGVQDFATRAPMTSSTIFRIYSMSKSVTAVGAMMLWEQGRFDLDDPVSDYLPEFAAVRVGREDGTTRAPARPITVRDLLLHTSGLNHRTSELYREAGVRDRRQTLDQFIANITATPLMEDPGSRYRYSESPTVVGKLIEIWSGQPLDVYLEDRIFSRLGMVDTGFWVEPGGRGRFAEVYGLDDRDRLLPVQIEDVGFTERPALLEGAVGLVSTAEDFLRFGQMLLNGGELAGVRLLQEETVRMITQNGLSPEITATRGGGTGWGLGNVSVVLDPAQVNEPANAGEYGWNGSAGTIYWVDPAEGIVAVLMTQSSPYFPDGLRQRFKSAIQRSIIPR